MSTLPAQATQPGLAGARRLVVKIGSALLVDEAKGTIRREWLDALADDVAALMRRGTEVLLVSSGAIAVGRRHLGLTQKALRLEEKQAAAATGQIRLAHAYQESLARHDITVASSASPPSRISSHPTKRRPWRPRNVSMRRMNQLCNAVSSVTPSSRMRACTRSITIPISVTICAAARWASLRASTGSCAVSVESRQ